MDDDERHDPRCAGLAATGVPVPEHLCTCGAIARRVLRADDARARAITRAH